MPYSLAVRCSGFRRRDRAPRPRRLTRPFSEPVTTIVRSQYTYRPAPTPVEEFKHNITACSGFCGAFCRIHARADFGYREKRLMGRPDRVRRPKLAVD